MSVLPANSSPPRNGFTLLEIMVALAIFSLAALAMVRLQGYSVRSTANLSDSGMAWQVARNVAVEILSNPAPPTLGETAGEELNGGQNWRWTATTAKTDDARLVTVDIDVVGTGNAALRD
jgi:general secretion pathway protein I